MPGVYEAATRFFSEDGWPVAEVEPGGLLRLAFRGESGRWDCLAQVREEYAQFVFYSLCPVNVPEHRRLAVAEFLIRTNVELAIGNFDFDLTDGQIRYKTSVSLDDGELTPGLMRPLVYLNVATMDKYLPTIMAISFSDAAPTEAQAVAPATPALDQGRPEEP